MPTAKTPSFSMSSTLRAALTRQEGDTRQSEVWFLGVKDPDTPKGKFILGFQDPESGDTYRGYLQTRTEVQDYLTSLNLDLAEVVKAKVAKKVTVTLVTSRNLQEYVSTSTGYRSVARPETKTTEVIDSICDF